MVFAVWLAALGTIHPTFADDDKNPKAETTPVEYQVLVIRATTKNAKIDPALKEIAEKLKKEYKFTGFKLEKKLGGKVKFDEPYATDLLGDYRIELSAKERKADKSALKLQCVITKKGQEKPVASTTFTIKPGEFQLIGVGKIDGDDTLIAAVSGK